MESTIKVTRSITIEFTEEDYKLFRDGIGNTSHDSRVSSGMTVKQSQFFTAFFEILPSTPLF